MQDMFLMVFVNNCLWCLNYEVLPMGTWLQISLPLSEICSNALRVMCLQRLPWLRIFDSLFHLIRLSVSILPYRPLSPKISHGNRQIRPGQSVNNHIRQLPLLKRLNSTNSIRVHAFWRPVYFFYQTSQKSGASLQGLCLPLWSGLVRLLGKARKSRS